MELFVSVVLLSLINLYDITHAIQQKCYECTATQYQTTTIDGVPKSLAWSDVKIAYNFKRDPTTHDDNQCNNPANQNAPNKVQCDGMCFTLIINGAW